jgi:hypothetical protein
LLVFPEVQLYGYFRAEAERLLQFVTVNMPNVAPPTRERYENHKDLLSAFASGEMQ